MFATNNLPLPNLRKVRGALWVTWTLATFASAAYAVHNQLSLHGRELGVAPSVLLSPWAEVYKTHRRNPVSLLLHPVKMFNLAAYFSVLLWICCSSFLLFTALFVGRLRRAEADSLERHRSLNLVSFLPSLLFSSLLSLSRVRTTPLFMSQLTHLNLRAPLTLSLN